MPLAVSFDAALQESQPDVAEALHGGVVYGQDLLPEVQARRRRFVLNRFPCSIIVTSMYCKRSAEECKKRKNRLYNDAGSVQRATLRIALVPLIYFKISV